MAVTALAWQLLLEMSNVEFQKHLSNTPGRDRGERQTGMTSTQGPLFLIS
jgi:hypothetical protein